jgi:hypothetical protein
MNTPIRALALLALALPLQLAAQMSGTYTVIPGGGGNYTTITAAVNDLNVLGVSGPVTISIASGVYDEAFTINAVNGASSVNTVTFTSAAASASSVILAPLSASAARDFAVIYLNGTDHVRFTLLTIDAFVNGIVYDGDVEDVVVQECVFEGNGAIGSNGITGYITHPVAFSVLECTFRNFNDGIRVSGEAADHGHTIRLIGNTITSNVEHAEGITCFRVDDVLIENNTIALSAAIPVSLVYSQGISLSSVVGPVRVAGNNVAQGTGGDALSLSDVQCDPAAPGRVENNLLQLTAAHSFTSGLYIAHSTHVEVFHNTVDCTEPRPSMRIAGLVPAISGINVQANIFSTTHTEVVSIPYPNALLRMDYNVYNGSGADVVVWYDTLLSQYVYDDLPEWQARGFDLHSIDADPLFVSTTDLHISTNSPAIGLAPYPALVANDIDGEARPGGANSLVEAGADELTVCLPLSGTYTVAASGPGRFNSFNAAKDALYICGISGPVVFQVSAGIYIETLYLPTEVPGASSVNTITFRGVVGDSTQVLLRAPVGSNSDLVNVHGADHFAFEHMTFDRSNGAGLGTLRINNTGAPTGIGTAFRSVRFLGNGISGASNILAFCPAADGAATTRFERCAFVNGYEGLRWVGAASETLTVDRCTFSGCILDAMNVSGMRAGLQIMGNTFIYSGTALSKGLVLEACNGAFRVQRNSFLFSGSGTGSGEVITLSNCVATANTRGGVFNNMVIAWDRTRFVGIRFSGTTAFCDVLNNSFSLKNTSITGAALEFANNMTGANNRISNNIFSSHNSYAVYKAVPSNVGTLRNNLLFTTQANVSFWGTANADIPALQAASGQFASSLEALPQFVSETADLHIQSTSPAVATGFQFPVVGSDFDLQTRPLPAATNPDIGADEIDQSAAFAPSVKRLDEVTDMDRVFPNPANEQLTIATDEPRAEHYRLFDLQGRITLEGILELPGTLDITAVAPGTYLLMLGDHTNLTRIIVQH